MKPNWESLVPLLVHIQANLEGDHSLETLGSNAGISPFHLHRLFKAAIGETPKAYTSRLLLERGAFPLLVHESSPLDIALECDYQSHETFIRAFRRRFGKSPSEYWDRVQGQASKWSKSRVDAFTIAARTYENSAT